MKHKRIHVRVPLTGEATLSNSIHPTIKARTIDISQGGVAIVDLSEELPAVEYQIEMLTEAGQRISISARLVRVVDSIAGFQTLQIDRESQEIIKHLIFEYQKSIDFIKQLDEYNLHKVIDEGGNEIEITFEQ
jgi:c-di-GMP-binding flagellar brake protein YcgR